MHVKTKERSETVTHREVLVNGADSDAISAAVNEIEMIAEKLDFSPKKLFLMSIQSESKTPIHETFLSGLPPETVSAICSHLNMKDFFRFQSCSKQYQKSELYNGLNYARLQSEFVFSFESEECPNADEILANVIKRGGTVKMSNAMLGAGTWMRMVKKSFFKLFEALRVRNLIGTHEIIQASQKHNSFRITGYRLLVRLAQQPIHYFSRAVKLRY